MNKGMENGTQMRFSPEEMSLIKNTFKDNTALLKLLRKFFLPEIDPTAPLGQMIDLWMTVSIKDKTPDEAYADLLARNQLIAHIDARLVELNLMASKEDLSPEELKKKMQKDSSI